MRSRELLHSLSLRHLDDTTFFTACQEVFEKKLKNFKIFFQKLKKKNALSAIYTQSVYSYANSQSACISFSTSILRGKGLLLIPTALFAILSAISLPSIPE